MLRIRAKHMEAFRAEAMIDFEERMIAHLRQFSPEHFHLLDVEQVRAVIREGVARAARHDLTSERSVRYYVDVMVLLGGGFDADPLLPWAATILASADDEAARVDRLYAAACAQVERALEDYNARDEGVDQERFIVELRRLRDESEAPLTAATLPDFRARVTARFAGVFARACEQAGDAGVSAAVDHGLASASMHGIVTERGAAIFVALVFFLGAGFTRDPLLPWVRLILDDAAPGGPAARVERLHAGVVAYLGQWWSRG